MKIALVHEWLTPKATGGSELVVKEILQFIDAQLFALIDFESVNPHSYLYQRHIETSFVQKLPFSRNGLQKYLPILPFAIEQLNVTDYDVVLSSAHAVAKGVITRPNQLHICYCHSPMRYAWDLTFDYLDRGNLGKGLKGLIPRYLLHQLRQWDVISANRVDYFIANSYHTARRIWRCYRREAQVIYPPVAVDKFPFQEHKEDYYVTVSRLVSYKKVDLIVRAFNQLGFPLVVIGDGEQMNELKSIAKSNIKLLGSVDGDTLKKYVANAQAFVYAACEDFGIAIVEAQACGTPIIAYDGGGAKETVIDIQQHPQAGTGILFSPQTEAGLIEGVNNFRKLSNTFNAQRNRHQAERFSAEVFKQEYWRFFEDCQQQFAQQRHQKSILSS